MCDCPPGQLSSSSVCRARRWSLRYPGYLDSPTPSRPAQTFEAQGTGAKSKFSTASLRPSLRAGVRTTPRPVTSLLLAQPILAVLGQAVFTAKPLSVGPRAARQTNWHPGARLGRPPGVEDRSHALWSPIWGRQEASSSGCAVHLVYDLRRPFGLLARQLDAT